MKLPEQFTDRMRKLLGQEEYARYEESFKMPRKNGLRVNTLKLSPEEFAHLSPFSLKSVPWCPNGFYYEKEDIPSRHPYYYAGLYYIQEPSAMAPASFLPVSPGDKVLDLCAAPGGKTTELGAKLGREGILVSNDISISRTKALLHNIELSGIPNAVVLSEEPARLSEKFPEYFDKILVDAPCSGEGMFRKDLMMIKEWSPGKVETYSALQKEILMQAAKMLKPGGMMIYSTCTFSPEEDEQTVEFLLGQSKEFSLAELPLYEGFDKGHPEWGRTGREELSKCRRLWPHKIEGEGHFVALFEKKPAGKTCAPKSVYPGRPAKIAPELSAFLKEAKLGFDEERIEVHGEKAYYMPEGLPDVRGLRIVRAGLFLGNIKKNRFEPSQPLAMAFAKGEGIRRAAIPLDDERLIRYLKCETIPMEGENGSVLVCVHDYPLGFGKLHNGILKNKYRPSWRWMRG